MSSLHLHRHLQSCLLDRRDCLILPHRKDLHIENFVEDASVMVDIVVVDMEEVDMVKVDKMWVDVVMVDVVGLLRWRLIRLTIMYASVCTID